TTSTSATTVLCAASCMSTATSTASLAGFYSFDSTLSDGSGNGYTASSQPALPTFVTGMVGNAISFTYSSSQYLTASSINFSARSFTIEFWFYWNVYSGSDNAFFGQFLASNSEQCLFMMIRSYALYWGFFNDDTSSSTSLSANTWYHAAFVYDYSARTRTVYLNGIQIGYSSAGVLATSGSTATIGGGQIGGSAAAQVYFNGYIDHLSYSTRAKSACEVLNDATLAAYFPFDSSLYDSGPNFLVGTSSGEFFTSGKVNLALQLNTTTPCYFQMQTTLALGTTNQAFTIALWIMPTTLSGVLVHVSSLSTGAGWCFPFLGFSSSSAIVAQIYTTSFSATSVIGPVIQTSPFWTHIVQTFSTTNGLRLYVNGALRASSTGSTGSSYSASGAQNYLTLGSNLGQSCATGSIVLGQYRGAIDELRVYSRELTSTEICKLYTG
ncbi:unnamed protein product, partial [Didymodactylos carnosus]